MSNISQVISSIKPLRRNRVASREELVSTNANPYAVAIFDAVWTHGCKSEIHGNYWMMSCAGVLATACIPEGYGEENCRIVLQELHRARFIDYVPTPDGYLLARPRGESYLVGLQAGKFGPIHDLLHVVSDQLAENLPRSADLSVYAEILYRGAKNDARSVWCSSHEFDREPGFINPVGAMSLQDAKLLEIVEFQTGSFKVFLPINGDNWSVYRQILRIADPTYFWRRDDIPGIYRDSSRLAAPIRAEDF